MWEQLLFDNASEILTATVSLFVAWVKKKYDLRKLKRKGLLIDKTDIVKNGKY